MKICLSEFTYKSFEELLIADWLFLNGVFYEYEFPFEFDTSSRKRGQYRPDFKLGEGIYLEHFGIDKNGKTEKIKKSSKKFIASVIAKRIVKTFLSNEKSLNWK